MAGRPSSPRHASATSRRHAASTSGVRFVARASSAATATDRCGPFASACPVWKNTCTARAASPSARSFSHARAACVATASCISPSSVTGRENDRLRTRLFRAGGAFSSGMQDSPRSSCTVRSPVTRRCCRTHASSSSRRSHAVRTPSPGSRRPYARPIPHTSPTAVVRRMRSRSASPIPQSETAGSCPRFRSTFAYAAPDLRQRLRLRDRDAHGDPRPRSPPAPGSPPPAPSAARAHGPRPAAPRATGTPRRCCRPRRRG